MKYTSVKFCFLFNFCKKNCKVGFFTSKYAKNRRFHAFFGLVSPELIKLRLCQSLHLLKIGKTALFRNKP